MASPEPPTRRTVGETRCAASTNRSDTLSSGVKERSPVIAHHLPYRARTPEAMLDVRPGVVDRGPVDEEPHITSVRLAKQPDHHLELQRAVITRKSLVSLRDGQPDVPQEVGNGIRIAKAFRGWRQSIHRSGTRDSNPRHPAWEAGTLPTELVPQTFENQLLVAFLVVPRNLNRHRP